MDFTYSDLDTYVDVVGATTAHLEDVRVSMSGAFPVDDRSADLEAALRHAELLLANAEALRNEIRYLLHSSRGV